jgi:hypothetical protein
MAAFVVVAFNSASSGPRSGARLNIFPGAATPAVFAAGSPFWVGYGFVPERHDGAESTVHPETGFALLVDGEAVPLATEVKTEGRRTVRKFTAADFPNGLPAGWHRFSGRWYDEGLLALTSDASIEFVER